MRYLLLAAIIFCTISVTPVLAQDDGDMGAMEMDWGMLEGMIVHTEIYVADLEKSAEFYTTLFNWEFSEDQEDYWSFMTPGDVSGGITNVAPGGPGGVLVYILVQDIDTKLEEIAEAGGKVFMEKTEIPDMGYFAIFSDLDGNLLGLFSM